MNAPRFFLYCLLVLGFLLPLSSAAEQTLVVQSQTASASPLVSVQGDANFAGVLEGQTHERELTVNFAVPPETLASLPDGRLDVFVRVRPESSDSWLWLSDAGKDYQTLAFTLSCRVANGRCDASQSVLSRAFIVRLRPPEGAAYPHDERVVITASTENQDEPAALIGPMPPGGHLPVTSGPKTPPSQNALGDNGESAGLNAGPAPSGDATNPALIGPMPPGGHTTNEGVLSDLTGLVTATDGSVHWANVLAALALFCIAGFAALKWKAKRDREKRGPFELGQAYGHHEPKTLPD